MNIRHELWRARQYLSIDPTASLAIANDVVTEIDLDRAEVHHAVVVLAEALRLAGLHTEILALVEACRERFPRSAELAYRKALAHQTLDQHEEMFAAYDVCLAIGDDSSHLCTAGAGTWLPFHQLGLFAEAHGDARTARQLYTKALAMSGYLPTAERLAFLEIMRMHVREARRQAIAA